MKLSDTQSKLLAAFLRTNPIFVGHVRGSNGNRNDLLTLSQQALVFMCLQKKSFENSKGKGEFARNKQFLLFPQYFLPVLMNFFIFIK